MNRGLFYFLALSAGLVLEALLRSAGFCLPLTAYAVFYCACVAGTGAGLAAAFFAGFALDSILGYSAPWSIPAFALILLPAWLLRNMIESDSPLLLVWVGAVLPLMTLLPVFPLRGGWNVTEDQLPALFLAAVLSAALLPLTVSVLDHFSGLLGLARYDEIKRRERT